MQASRGAVEFQIDPKQVARIVKSAERYRNAPLRQRMAKGTLKAADYLVRPMRAAAPVGKTRNLQRSVRARQARARVGNTFHPTLGSVVGPTAPHRHLVIRRTRPHSLATKKPDKSQFSVMGNEVRPTRILQHPGNRTPNPFVDRTAQRYSRQAFRIVSDVLFNRQPYEP